MVTEAVPPPGVQALSVRIPLAELAPSTTVPASPPPPPLVPRLSWNVSAVGVDWLPLVLAVVPVALPDAP